MSDPVLDTLSQLSSQESAPQADPVLASLSKVSNNKTVKPVPLDTQSQFQGMPWYKEYPLKAWMGFGSTYPSAWQGVKQLAQSLPSELEGGAPPEQVQQIQQDRPRMMAPLQNEIDESKALQSGLGPAGAIGKFLGNTNMAAATMAAPGANSLQGSGIIGAGQGMLLPTSTGESRGLNTAIGGLGGLGGYAIGSIPGLVKNLASRGASAIEAKVSAKAAADAAAETLSARSAAGTAAQDAYRQLEHLRELGALRTLSPQEAQTAAQLEQELADKAAQKLVPSVAKKEATSLAYQDAMNTEPQRAQGLLSDRLSSSEVMNQIMARVKRYGPAAAGGLASHFLFPSIGAGEGVAMGLVLRPAIRSMFNLAKNPAVQYGLLSKIGGSGALGNPAIPPALGLLTPELLLANRPQ